MELDTLARHGVAVVAVIGNNGIWALEKHPMEALYGYSVAADLRPETRYDQVVEALGCHGELVRHADELRPALERALATGGPALVNVLTDPGGRVSAPVESGIAPAGHARTCATSDPTARAQTRRTRTRAPEYENRPHSQRAASDPGLAQSGRAGVRARKGRLEWLGRREAPMSAASPEPMLGAKRPKTSAPRQCIRHYARRDNRTFVQIGC